MSLLQENDQMKGEKDQAWLPFMKEMLGKLMADGVDEPILTRALKGGAKGFGVVGGIMALLRRERFSRYELQMAGTAGCFVGSYRLFASLLTQDSIRESISQSIGKTIGTKEESIDNFLKNYSPGITGWLAAFLSLSLTKFEYSTNSLFATYCFTRAVWFSTSSNPLMLPEKFERFYPVMWMCFSAWVNLGRWIAEPHLLDPKYSAFLNRQGGHNMDYLPFHKYPLSFRQGCMHIHPNVSHGWYLVTFFLNNMKLAAKLYIPIHLFILLVSRNRSLFNFGFGLFRSSVFLALYCTFAWMGFCYKNIFDPEDIVTHLSVANVTWVAGLPVLLEDQRRQSLLAAYCVTYAIDSLYRVFLDRYGLRHTKRLGSIIILLSAATLFQNYQRWVPHMIQKKLLQTQILEGKEEEEGKEGKVAGEGKEKEGKGEGA